MQALFTVIGALLAAEGAFLLMCNKESWRRLRELLSAFSVGQVHTVGALMLAAGVLFLLFASAV
ncbi:MAG: hypothetical protein ACR2QC_07415 [Gammaproteobacteria bacterium]